MSPRNQKCWLLLPLAALLVGVAAFLPAQTPSSFSDFNPRFEHFKLPGGEAVNQVQCIVQDSLGFLWFGSSAGLIRYDGQSYVTYRFDPLDTNSIASDQVEWIFLDKRGMLWLGHWGAGVTVFDPRNRNCIRYNISNGLSNNFVSMIVEDREGFIWIATKEGLNRFNLQTGQFKTFVHLPGDSRSLSYNFVRSLYVDKRGVLWVGCGSPFDDNDPKGNLGGLNCYHPEDGTFTCFLQNPRDPSSLSDNRVRAIFEDSKGNFWVGTGGAGLHRMDRKTGRFTRLPFDATHPSRLSTPVLQKNEARFPPFYHITFISEDQRGRMWIGAAEGGLNVFDPETNTVRHFEQVTGMTDSLQTNALWHFCQTRDGVVWLSSGGLGGKVFRVKNTNHLFPFFNAGQLGLEHGTFPGVAKDSTGNTWLQVRGDFSGIVRFEPKSGQWKRFAYEPANVAHTFLDFEELKIDDRGNIWASTPQGLYRMNPKRMDETNRHFMPDADIAQQIDYKTLWPPYFDSNGNTWIATWGDGLYRLNTKMELTHFRHDTAVPGSIGGNQVEKVFEDSEGNIVVHGGSINIDSQNPMFFDRFEPDPLSVKGTFKHLLPPGEMGDPCRAVEDNKGNFWFVAFPYGVRKLDTTGAYTSYTVANGALPSNAVTDMVLGLDGHIWMTSTGYIIESDPETESFYTYSVDQGVQNLAWTWVTGSCIGPDGEIIFSGEGGFHAFYPEEIRRLWHKNPATLRLTGLKIFGKEVVPGRSSTLNRPIWETSEIRLPHDRNVFSFQISCFDFYGPELSRLEFMLENYDRNWRNDLREGEANYVNVPPGEYVFKVRGANSMGVWDKNGVNLSVVVLPPWWATWWAYLLYTALFFGGIFSLYRFQLNHRLEHAETLRLQELDTVKTKLYTNITHEFRTPLTVILGMAQQVFDNPKEHFRNGLDMIIRNGQNLLDLVNQMLDLSKLESGKLSLHLQQRDVVNFLKYLVESFHSLAESKDIKIHFLNDVEALTMDFDAERLQQVVSNLLSNAVKFTPEGGHVYLSVGSTGQMLAIKVKDTGIGISEESLPYIFDRFYQADDTHTRHGEGTGIGLTLTKELVKLMEGDITVKSTQGNGTEFVVALPVRRAAAEKQTDNSEPLWKSGKTAIPTPSTPVANQSSDEKPLVLIAEDNADVVAYLASCLATDYRLAVAKDGQECEEIAFDIIPDLVVTDVMMPRKDGFEVCETLKKDERTSHIPLVMLTAKADLDSRLEGLKRGADAYLMKPFHKEELLLRIKKLLELRQKLQQHYLALAGLAESAVVEKNMLPVSNVENAFVTKARKIVDAHLDDFDFDVEKFCRALTMSHPQVHRKLSALTGLSANKFIRSIRLNKAESLLLNPELSITAVAFDSGFNDPSYFGKVFKQEFGLTPLEWRERHGAKS